MDTKEQILINELRNNLKEVIKAITRTIGNIRTKGSHIWHANIKKNPESSALIYTGFCFATSSKAPL